MGDSISNTNKIGLTDIRMLKPLVFYDKKTQYSIVLQQSESFELNKKSFSFQKPNNISLFLKIADREKKLAKGIFTTLLESKMQNDNVVSFDEIETSKLYDYFEHIQTSIIAIYTAVEALSNVAIPNNYELVKVNNKKVKETWNKENIERWMPTSEKLSEVLPEILKIDSPKKKTVWPLFKQLEEIRNDIIHQRTTSENKEIMDTLFLRKFFMKEIFTIIDSGFGIIQYFCIKDQAHSFFPLGFGNDKIATIEVDDIKEYFAAHDAEEK